MKEQIMDLLRKYDYALTVQEIYDCLNLNEVDDLKKLLKELDALEKALLVYRTKKDKYMLFQNCHLKAGKFIANKNGYGFVDINEPEDIFIAKSNINKAIHGDTVFVEVIDETIGKKEGKIVKIVDRSAKELVGEYNLVKNVGLVTPDDDHYKFKIEVAFDDSKTETITATFALKTYTITYNAGTGEGISGSHANDTKTHGVNLTLPGVTFTRTG